MNKITQTDQINPLRRVRGVVSYYRSTSSMIYYPIQSLANAGIQEIMIVTGGNSAGDFLRLLGNGKDFGLKRRNYSYQEGEGGIADALRLAEHVVDGESVCDLGR